jgi:hypothetical protein
MRLARFRHFAAAAGGLLLVSTAASAQTPQTVEGRLTRSTSAGNPRSEHSFEVRAGQRIEVTLRSDDFDAFLELVPPSGDGFYRASLENDDYGGTTDARVTAIASGDGTWRAVVSAFDERAGNYALEIALGAAGRITSVERRPLGDADSVSMKGRRYAVHSVTLQRDAQLLVEMISEGFEPYIIVESPSGARFTSEGDPEGSTARVDVNPAEPGRWRVLATQNPSEEQAQGTYALRMIEVSSEGSDALTGALEERDPKDIDGEHYDQHQIPGSADRPLVVQLFSSAFDAYLSARSPSGQWFRDDDGAGGTNARLELPAGTGTWLVVVTSFSGAQTGSYRLTIGR